LQCLLQILGFPAQGLQKSIVIISVPTVYNSASKPFVAALVQKKKAHDRLVSEGILLAHSRAA
jgi:hypothetical protein